MKVCVFGAGALGGHLAAQLIAANQADISLIARGAHLAAIRERGLTLKVGGHEVGGKPAAATDNPATLPPQDIVFVALKAQTLPAAAQAIGKLVKPDGCAVFLMNGIPWWFNYGLPGNKGTLPLLDPQGTLRNQVKPGRAIGCVVLCPCDIVEPGVIVNMGALQLILGEPDGASSERIEAVAAMLRRGGVDSRVSGDLRRDILQKLVSNAPGNSLSALTRMDFGGLGSDPDLCELAAKLIREVLAIAAALGWALRSEIDVDSVARRNRPGQRPSMLQDVLQGRPLEVEAHLGQLQSDVTGVIPG